MGGKEHAARLTCYLLFLLYTTAISLLFFGARLNRVGLLEREEKWPSSPTGSSIHSYYGGLVFTFDVFLPLSRPQESVCARISRNTRDVVDPWRATMGIGTAYGSGVLNERATRPQGRPDCQEELGGFFWRGLLCSNIR